MTTRRTIRRTARHSTAFFFFALASTLVIFAGVDRLATPALAGAVLVQAQHSAPQA
jgi:hypothetical protein